MNNVKLESSEVYEFLQPRKEIDFIDTAKRYIERSIMNEELVIKKELDNLFEVIKTTKNTFADGFQFSDIFSLTGLLPKLISIGLNINNVKSEIATINKDQSSFLLSEFAKKGTELFFVNNDLNNGNIESLKLVLNEISDCILIVIDKLKDGWQVSDLTCTPDLIGNIWNIAQNGKTAIEESKKLSAQDISELFILLGCKVLGFVL